MMRVLLLVIFLLISSIPVCAKDSATIRVSCSIPAVPGLNAPARYDATEQDHEPKEETQIVAEEEEEVFTVLQKEEAMSGKDHLASLTSVYTR